MWQRIATPWIQIKDELYNTGQITKIAVKEKRLYFSNGEDVVLKEKDFDELLNTLFEYATLTYSDGHQETF